MIQGLVQNESGSEYKEEWR